MKTNLSLVLIAAIALAGCAGSSKSADVSVSVRRSLDDAGLRDVSVNQDREKGIVTLGGHVSSEQDKARAESLARPLAAGQVVAMEVAVIPVGDEALPRPSIGISTWASSTTSTPPSSAPASTTP